jgi:hypothetical protein
MPEEKKRGKGGTRKLGRNLRRPAFLRYWNTGRRARKLKRHCLAHLRDTQAVAALKARVQLGGGFQRSRRSRRPSTQGLASPFSAGSGMQCRARGTHDHYHLPAVKHSRLESLRLPV